MTGAFFAGGSVAKYNTTPDAIGLSELNGSFWREVAVHAQIASRGREGASSAPLVWEGHAD
jgi:hypothetical protein